MPTIGPAEKEWDLLIRRGRIFNGQGAAAIRGDIAVKNGKVVARGARLNIENADEVIDADGKWVMPGLVDAHTHYDLEVELTPGLPESVRHGTTTVIMSNCSLGLAFGAQRRDGDDPIVSCFARVENMPKHVLKKVADLVTWQTSAEYISHLEALNLGPNIVPMVPHSMLRIEVMGLKESVSRTPTADELIAMKALLEKAIIEGYPGFSTDALPFHFLANDPCRDKQIPTQFATYSELKELTRLLRQYDRTWQATPPKDSPLEVFKTFLLTSSRLHKKPLKTTVVAALDVATNRNIVKLGKVLNWLMNSRLVQGKFYLQALAAPFKVWSDGAYSPLAEEIDELRELIELDLENRDGRLKLLNDPAYIERFRKMWMSGKSGFGLARLRRLLRLEPLAFSRSFEEMIIEKCPVENWAGRSFQDIFDEVVMYRKTGEPGTLASNTLALLDAHMPQLEDEADFMLGVLRAFDNSLVWYTVTANRDPSTVRKLIMNPKLLPGFNDSGAHLTNMAFYDGNLRALQLAAQGGEPDISYMVKRLTTDTAEVFGITIGGVEIGQTADIIMIDPVALRSYDSEANTKRIYREEFEHDQLVNRSCGVVALSLIGGKIIWRDAAFAPTLNAEAFGQLLLAANIHEQSLSVPSATALAAE